MSRIRSLRRWGVAAALVAGLLTFGPTADGQPPAKGDDKTVTIKGQTKLGVTRLRMETGKMYVIRVEANGFTPNVQILPQQGQFIGNPQDRVVGDTFSTYFIPQATRDYKIVVTPNLDADEDAAGDLLDYVVTATPISMSGRPLLEIHDKLTNRDPNYNSPQGGNRGPGKTYEVNFKAGELYIITLNQEGGGGWDPYLFLEGPPGKYLTHDDDSNGNLNSKIIWKAKKTGPHRLVVTALGGIGGRLGEFELKVVTTAAGAVPQPKNPAVDGKDD